MAEHLLPQPPKSPKGPLMLARPFSQTPEISDPIANLDSATSFAEAQEVMEAFLRGGILFKKGEYYYPTQKNPDLGRRAIEAFRNKLIEFRGNGTTRAAQVKSVRTQAKKAIKMPPGKKPIPQKGPNLPNMPQT